MNADIGLFGQTLDAAYLRIRELEAQALRQNKVMHLAAQDEVFFGGFIYDPDDREFQVPRPLVLCNDFFAPAADCEEFEPEDIDAIHDAYLRFGHYGVIAWVSLKRGGANPWRLKDGKYRMEFEAARNALAETQGRETIAPPLPEPTRTNTHSR